MAGIFDITEYLTQQRDTADIQMSTGMCEGRGSHFYNDTQVSSSLFVDFFIINVYWKEIKMLCKNMHKKRLVRQRVQAEERSVEIYYREIVIHLHETGDGPHAYKAAWSEEIRCRP